MPRYKPMIERFREKYVLNTETGCWDWQGAKVGIGYGAISRERGGGNVVASRYSYETFVGPIPAGAVVCHRCDNPGCVNPDHLYAADHLTNMREMARKGRARVLSADEVKACQKLVDDGHSFSSIARDVGVSRSTVQRALAAANTGDFGGKEGRKGSQYYTILTDDDRAAIKAALRDETLSIMRIAKMFNVDRRTVRNIRDGKSGEGRHTKITKEQVLEVIEYWRAGFRQAEIGELFGISQTMVSKIVVGKAWKGLKSTREVKKEGAPPNELR